MIKLNRTNTDAEFQTFISNLTTEDLDLKLGINGAISGEITNSVQKINDSAGW